MILNLNGKETYIKGELNAKRIDDLFTKHNLSTVEYTNKQYNGTK